VQCDCGETFEIKNNYMLREPNPKCKKCEYNEGSVVSIGQVFDKLTVIGFINDPNIDDGKKRCVCRCDCGNDTFTIRPSSLLINEANNCGCNRRRENFVGKLGKTMFSRFKRNAKKRGISFEVDMEYLWKLYEDQGGKCALTGLPIIFGEKSVDSSTASIDRIDSTKGYIAGNLQWVHKDINCMKWNIPQDKFIEFCKLAVDYNEKLK